MHRERELEEGDSWTGMSYRPEMVGMKIAWHLTGAYLHTQQHVSKGNHRRFVYNEVVAALGVVFSLLFLFQCPKRFSQFPLDFTLFILLITAFCLIANVCSSISCSLVHMVTMKFIGHLGCVVSWRCITGNTVCQKLKTDIVFCFLDAIFFFASGMLGLWITLRRQIASGTGDGDEEDTPSIRWYLRENI